MIQLRLHCRANVSKLLYVQEAKQLEEARLKPAKEQKKKQDMEAAARLAVQRRAAEQAARQQVEAEMQKKRIDRQSRVCQPMHCNQWPYLQTQTSCKTRARTLNFDGPLLCSWVAVIITWQSCLHCSHQPCHVIKYGMTMETSFMSGFDKGFCQR